MMKGQILPWSLKAKLVQIYYPGQWFSTNGSWGPIKQCKIPPGNRSNNEMNDFRDPLLSRPKSGSRPAFYETLIWRQYNLILSGLPSPKKMKKAKFCHKHFQKGHIFKI